MQYTPNYNLPKFDSTDELETATRTALNTCHTTIDTQMKANANNVASNSTKIGTLANLETTEKTNLVGAINELAEDYIVAQGTSDVWTYRKWNSGIAECWGEPSYTVTSWTAWGTAYEGNPLQKYSYPSGLFTSAPKLNACPNSSAGTWLEFCGTSTTTKTPVINVLRPNSAGGVGVGLHMYAIGRWK